MKKSISLSVSLFIFIVLCLSVSTTNAAPNRTDQAYVSFGNYNPTSGELEIIPGSPADHADDILIITNPNNQKLTNIRFIFYDAQGNNITLGGNYYLYPNEIPAHGETVISLNQLVLNFVL